LASGQLLTAAVLWEMAYFTPDVSQWTLIRTGVPELLRAYRAREPWCEGRRKPCARRWSDRGRRTSSHRRCSDGETDAGGLNGDFDQPLRL
jgi:hypothetical protein